MMSACAGQRVVLGGMLAAAGMALVVGCGDTGSSTAAGGSNSSGGGSSSGSSSGSASSSGGTSGSSGSSGSSGASGSGSSSSGSSSGSSGGSTSGGSSGSTSSSGSGTSSGGTSSSSGSGSSSGSDGGTPVTGFPTVTVFEADACHDLDIAVNATLVASATNSGHVVFYKKDGTQDHVQDFAAGCGDQHIQWDDSTKRWFFSVMDCGQTVKVFASTDEAGQTWTPTLTVTLQGSLDDVQLNVTTDKVLLLNADCIYPLDKTTVMAGGQSVTPTGSCGIAHDDQTWALHYGYPEPSTAYFATMADDQNLNWISVDGTGTSINVQQHMVPVSGFTSFPVSPGVPQPGGTQLRASGALGMWQNNQLWWSKVDTCAGGLACPRIFHVQTDTNKETDFQFAVPNVGTWSAAAGIDASGNMWSLMSESSSSVNPSLAVGGYSAAGMTTQPQVVFQGTAPDVTGMTFGDWGDFFACDQDPADGSVWCIGNYGGPKRMDGCPTPAKIAHITTK